DAADGLARTITWGMLNTVESSLRSMKNFPLGRNYTCQICFDTKVKLD
ncbi:unnamed protein product, partial [Heterosigma akashiwo]